MKRLILWLACWALLAITPVMAGAHALDPGYLQVQPLNGDTWRVFWRKPAVSGAPMEIDARLPDSCTPDRAEAEPTFDGQAFVTQWLATCPDGLAGGQITIAGLEATRTDALIRVTLADGTDLTARVTPDNPSFDIPAEMSGWAVFQSYVALGFEHILEGWDHLLFVFALLVLIRSPGRLAGAITAFTLAHSLTLALATMGVLVVPSPPVEAAIALSIVLLAVEILRGGTSGDQLTARFPWIVSFAFGLLHGLGFAGALTEIGLPQGDIPLALLAFNVGVEAGQLTFVFGVLALYGILRWIWPRMVDVLRGPGAPGTVMLGYGIGIVSTYWLAERVAGF